MASTHDHYYPARWPEWECRKPAEVGMSAEKIQRAIEFSQQNETELPHDLEMNTILKLDELYSELIGPVKERGDVTGLVMRHGHIVAEWGDTERVDMTFSATKSYLSSVAGLAFDRGLIRSVHDRAGDYVRDGGFDSPHNAPITWHQLLNQTSDWQGTLWGKPDWADRPEGDRSQWANRTLYAPGTHWKYNDVRVNRLALSLLRIWRRPLAQVLHEHIMDPIGASPAWEWHGYDNSWVTINGQHMQSVTGGGHWGGGLWISARDHARFGYLCLRNGRWQDRQILSEQWIRMARTPTGDRNRPEDTYSAQYGMPAKCQVTYGYMNWMLNTNKRLLPSCPETSFFHAGNGANIIWVDQEHDLVVVIRWIRREQLDEFLGLVLSAVERA
ncbi:MAG: serine hydrolase [Bacillota bacterium]|nr:serine hydrolase [Bacillota bacterium]